ncbi:hypothetical protein JCM11491_005303 [Sporobolomyces phaffii]
MSHRFLCSLFLTSLFAFAKAQAEQADSEPRVIAGYEPKLYLSVIGIVLYGLSGGLHWLHWYRNRNNRYMLTLSIGMSCMVLGFILRIVYRGALDSVGVYAIMTLFILLSPCTFLATNYMILTRLAHALNAESALFIRASRVVRIFVWSDVFTFFLQAAGGGLSASKGSADTGHKIALVGLALQLVSYGLFCCLLIIFGTRVPRMFPGIEDRRRAAGRDSSNPFATTSLHRWRSLYALLLLTSVGIIVRSVFRLVEYTQGYSGYLPTHEGYFWSLDALPLWLAMSLYAVWWPARYVAGATELNPPRFSDDTSDDDADVSSKRTTTTTTQTGPLNEFKLVPTDRV